jgi:hypothetical protein
MFEIKQVTQIPTISCGNGSWKGLQLLLSVRCMPPCEVLYLALGLRFLHRIMSDRIIMSFDHKGPSMEAVWSTSTVALRAAEGEEKLARRLGT